MSLTRLDCYFFRGERVSPDRSSFVALNPSLQPGSMALAISCAVRQSIGSQVACRLSLEHFVDGIFDYFSEQESISGRIGPESKGDASLAVLEAAFRKANASVYSFGHKLAAGGRMAATMLGLVIEDHLIAAGRAGGGAAYLYRAGELFPFFEGPPEEQQGQGSEEYLGTNSLISVELASVPVQESDLIYVFGSTLTPDEENRLVELTEEVDFQMSNPCWEIAQFLFDKPEEVPVAMLARVGPETIYLSEPLAAAG